MAPAQKLIFGLKVPKVHCMKILLLPCEKGCFSASDSIHLAAIDHGTQKIFDLESWSCKKYIDFRLLFGSNNVTMHYKLYDISYIVHFINIDVTNCI